MLPKFKGYEAALEDVFTNNLTPALVKITQVAFKKVK